MKTSDQHAAGTGNKRRTEQAEARSERAEARTERAEARTERAETRTAQAEARTEQAEARTVQAESRAERAETRTEHAETRTEQAETRTEQAEQAQTTRQHVVRKEVDLREKISTRLLKSFRVDGIAHEEEPLEQLTGRQREILRLIAEGQNTKGIASLLKVSPKTVEYHRMKLMNSLNVHDIPGLVRFALRVGLILQEADPGAVDSSAATTHGRAS